MSEIHTAAAAGFDSEAGVVVGSDDCFVVDFAHDAVHGAVHDDDDLLRAPFCFDS
jgi:hypothetical protein